MLRCVSAGVRRGVMARRVAWRRSFCSEDLDKKETKLGAYGQVDILPQAAREGGSELTKPFSDAELHLEPEEMLPVPTFEKTEENPYGVRILNSEDTTPQWPDDVQDTWIRSKFGPRVVYAENKEQLPDGYAEAERDRQLYMRLCKQVMLTAKRELPEGYVYRDLIIRLYTFRLRVSMNSEKVSEIEDMIEAGPFDELIDAAKDELELLPKLREWEPWTLKDKEMDTEGIPDFTPYERKFFVE